MCPACGGTGLTEKEQHTHEVDSQGNLTPQINRFLSACNLCGGSKVVYG